MAIRYRDETRLRALLARECARLMADEGVKDFKAAKRKAAARLGVGSKAMLPANVEIEQALLDYQRLFKSAEQPAQLRALREAAVEAMGLLERFRPRLVGPVLAGTADLHAEVNLHLFADTSEEVMVFLLERAIPFETHERRLRLANGEYGYFPAFCFRAGEIGVELTVFSHREGRQAPRSPVDGRPMRRAGLAEVKALLGEEG